MFFKQTYTIICVYENRTTKQRLNMHIEIAPSEYHIEGESGNHVVDAWNKEGDFWILAWSNTNNITAYEYLERLQHLQDDLEARNPQNIDPTKRSLTIGINNPMEDLISFEIDRFEPPEIEEAKLIHARFDTEFFAAKWGDIGGKLALVSHHNDPDVFTNFVFNNCAGIERSDLYSLINHLTQVNERAKSSQ